MSEAAVSASGRGGFSVGGFEESYQRARGGLGGAQIVGGEGGADLLVLVEQGAVLLRQGRRRARVCVSAATAQGQEQAETRHHEQGKPTGVGRDERLHARQGIMVPGRSGT